MKPTEIRKSSITVQLSVSFSVIAAIAIPSYFASDLIGYRTVALVLLLAVSVLSMLFDIIPVLVTALVSALVWNFFFIPPVFTFHIGDAEDGLMALMYFVVALINVVLTTRIRKVERDARDKQEKENTIRLYNTLLNSLSHELRTPISTIIGAVDTIRENKSKLSEQQTAELIGEIDIAGIRLNRQVENLLNMSRLESGFLKLKLDWCDLNELIYEVIKDNRTECLDHKFEFLANDKLPIYRLDRGLVEQVLQNIVHNAVQHTPEGTIIRISVQPEKLGCVLVIEDNGPGFPAESIGNAFDKFFRLPQASTGGTGLGLSIVKGYVEAHRGTIILENILTGGSRFIIHLPAEASSIPHTQ